MILYIDTETTGKADFNLRASDPSQPHLVRLSGIIATDDGIGMELFDTLIKPEGWTIPEEVTKIHGITNEMALEKGIPEAEAAAFVKEKMLQASLIVAHNMQFDKFIIRIALRRHKLLTDEEDAMWKALPTYCTMKQSTNILRIPHANGRGFKWPTLAEAYKAATGDTLSEAHDSTMDVQAVLVIHNWLKQKESNE